MHKMILKISMASKMAAKLNNYLDHGAKEVSFCNFDYISCINTVLPYAYII